MPNVELDHDTKIPKPAPGQAFELSVYEPNPDKPGYLRFVRNLTFFEAAEKLRAAINPWVDEYISFTADMDKRANVNAATPSLWRVSAWAVEGSNEGHYVHVEFRPTADREKAVSFALIKTLLGEDYAWELAKFVTRVMQP